MGAYMPPIGAEPVGLFPHRGAASADWAGWRAGLRSGTGLREAINREFPMKKQAIAAVLVAAAAVFASTGCAVVRDQQSVGSYIDDATLTTRVKARFAENTTVSAMSIRVETLQGVVQLSGFAKSTAERSTAEDIARNTSGVRGVRNDIIVKP